MIRQFIQLFGAISDRDMDEIIEGLPIIITEAVSVIKVLNIRSNRNRFKKLFELVAKGWKQLEAKKELYMIEKMTIQGSKLSTLYRRKSVHRLWTNDFCNDNSIYYIIDKIEVFLSGTLLTFLLIFVLLPLLNPILDILVPLNETRSRHHILKVNYVILDEYEHFYAAYMHLSACAALVVLIIITVDSLYITVIYHACGLFAACGYQIQQATDNNSLETNVASIEKGGYGDFRQCVIMHNEAILFYDTLEKCCRNLYMIQMGLNMLIISLTAVEVVIYLDRPEELIRAVVFLVAQKFHLYVISLPGQMLLDQSIDISDKIYDSKWYQMPVNIQRLLNIMQVRSNRPCILTAGGIYEMKIESFGMTVKTCISYMTMFLSFRE